MESREPEEMSMRNRQQTKTVTFRLYPEVKEKLEIDAEKAGLSVSGLVKFRACGEAAAVMPTKQKRIPANAHELRRIMGELGKIGSNLNQIARFINSTDSFDSEKISLKLIEHHMRKMRKALLRMV